MRRWFQVSLRTLLLLILVVATFFGGVTFERRRAEIARPRIVFNPVEIDFGRVKAGNQARCIINIHRTGYDELAIIDARTDYKYLEAKIIHSEVEHADYLVVYLTKDAPLGEIDEQLVIVTNDAKQKRFTIRVRGKVESSGGGSEP